MSKEKQIEEITEIIRPFVSGLACEEESGSCEFVNCQYCRARDVARKIYDKGYRKQTGHFLVKENGDIVPIGQSEWISVEERLPETTDKMLVYDSEGYVYVGTYMRGGRGGTWITSVMGGGPITHWMPLPEAPKMKGSAE